MPSTATRSIREITADESAKFPNDDYEATREIGQSSGVGKLFRNLLTRSVGKVRLAKSLDVLRSQINTLAPQRRKKSDGWIGDGAHQSRTSDHNPWVRDGSAGVVTALDITHDPENGCDAGAIAETLRLCKDPRIKYIIWNRRIASCEAVRGKPAWEWRPYTGSNHDHHFHLSVSSDKTDYDSEASWPLASTPVASAPAESPPVD